MLITHLISALSLAATTQSVSVGKIKTIDSIRAIAIAAAPTGSQIVVASEDGKVRLMDGRSMTTIRELTPHLQAAYGVAWSKDGKTIATGDETARIYLETPEGKKLREYRTHTKGIEKLCFSSDCATLLSTGKDDQLNLYKLGDKKPKEARHILGAGANVYGAVFNPANSSQIITGVLDKGARIYDAGSGAMKAVLPGHDGQGVLDVAISPSGGRAVSTGKDGSAIVWDLATKKPVGTLRGHQDWVIAATFSPNGKYIATSSTDGTVRVWNAYNCVAVGKLAEQTNVGSPVCFTADGKTLVTVNDAGAIQFNFVLPGQGSAEPPAKAKRTKRKRGK